MNRRITGIEEWLGELGEAQAQGVFLSDVGRCPPWRVTGGSDPVQPVRVATQVRRPVVARWAVAAAVVLALGGLWRLESVWTTPAEPVRESLTAMASRDSGEGAARLAASLARNPRDYNGDGKLDGDDIQAYVLQKAQKAQSEADASDFARQLLGS
jgi:cytochrome c-type biogenesis protein CcmH/NrfG